MIYSRLADDFLSFAGQKIALAGDHGCRDSPRIAANDFVDAARQRIAAAIDRHHGRGREPGRFGSLRNLNAPQHIADRAEPREPGVAGEIIAAGKARAGGGSSLAFRLT